ncbi:nucleotidyltransferase [Slackia exigua]|uniref:nucleotidyltransferase n=1 Tax=Slackia exigua TaxID=84109 RepID=UPI0028D690F2|nr:nucleotidyltransferase [Slackia exigua]
MEDELFSRYMEGQLASALGEIEMPDSYYDKAISAYGSVSRELTAESSSLYEHDPEIILQGSIKIGTAIKPVSDDGSYDVDMVCNLRSLDKSDMSQKTLKEMVGVDVKAYARRHGMSNKPHNGKRCWTLEYVDDANFHLDILPTLDDTCSHSRAMLAKSHCVPDGASYLVHTDKRHPLYERICDDWPTTNPKGFARWFLGVAQVDEERKRLALAKSVSIEKIEVYKVKLPLQRYIQLLKRHKDIYFSDSANGKCVRSIVVTTLAAKAYESIPRTGNWYDDFVSTVEFMPRFIWKVGEGYKLTNPSDPLENFVDGWDDSAMHIFENWHSSVLEDLVPTSSRSKKGFINRYAWQEMRRSLGLPERIGGHSLSSAARVRVEALSHHQQHGLTEIDAVEVAVSATKTRSGGIPTPFKSGDPLPKGVSLRFEAQTEGAKRYEVRWQVTNDGEEALRAGCLRGDFYHSSTLPNGRKTRIERTCYTGQHYVECILVKDDVVYGRSEPFVVNIVAGNAAHLQW